MERAGWAQAGWAGGIGQAGERCGRQGGRLSKAIEWAGRRACMYANFLCIRVAYNILGCMHT